MEGIDLDQFLDKEVNLGQFFKEEKLKSMTDGEKQRLKNIAQNYEIMIHMGFPAIKPDFMKGPAHRARAKKLEDSDDEDVPVVQEKSCSDDSDDETWTPDLERRKRSKEMKRLYPSYSVAKKIKFKAKDQLKKEVKVPVAKKRKVESSEKVSKQYNLRERSTVNCMVLEVPDDDHFIYCEECNKEYDMDCPVHGPLDHIKDTETATEFDSDRALHSLPSGLVVKQSSIPNAGLGVFTEKEIPARVMFGPYGGIKCYDQQKAHDSGYCWQIHADGKPSHYVDAQNKANSNWMRYVNCAPSENEQNLVAFQYKGGIYYRSYKVIASGSELLCWYGNEYGRELGLVRDKNLLIRPKLVNGEDLFPCVFCKIAFSTVVFNVRHLIKQHGKDKLTPSDVQTLDEWLRENDKEEYFKKKLTKVSTIDKGPKNSPVNKNSQHNVQTSVLKQKSNMSCNSIKHPGNDNKAYKCYVCVYSSSKSCNLKSHMRIHSGDRPYKCDVCGDAFSRNYVLKSHMRIHSGEKPYKCDVCEDAFTQNSHLKIHMRIHSGERPYKCDVCGDAFTQNHVLKKHMRKHSGEKPYKCDVCGDAFSRNSHRKIHMRIHSGEKPYKCEVCGDAFSRNSHLKIHMRIHSGEKPYKCEVCGNAFYDSSNLKKHMRIHSGEKPYKCDVCGDAFAVDCNLKSHMRIHSGEKPYKCDVCGDAFTQSSVLKSHMRIHSGEKPYKCDVCGDAFSRNDALKSHMRIHSGEKPYKCDVCGNAFSRNDALKNHMRIHSGEKPYKCDVCGYAAAESSALKKHMRIHSGEKPYKCDVCGDRFSRNYILKTHMRNHSENKPL